MLAVTTVSPEFPYSIELFHKLMLNLKNKYNCFPVLNLKKTQLEHMSYVIKI